MLVKEIIIEKPLPLRNTTNKFLLHNKNKNVQNDTQKYKQKKTKSLYGRFIVYHDLNKLCITDIIPQLRKYSHMPLSTLQ